MPQNRVATKTPGMPWNFPSTSITKYGRIYRTNTIVSIKHKGIMLHKQYKETNTLINKKYGNSLSIIERALEESFTSKQQIVQKQFLKITDALCFYLHSFFWEGVVLLCPELLQNRVINFLHLFIPIFSELFQLL